MAGSRGPNLNSEEEAPAVWDLQHAGAGNAAEGRQQLLDSCGGDMGPLPACLAPAAQVRSSVRCQALETRIGVLP